MTTPLIRRIHQNNFFTPHGRTFGGLYVYETKSGATFYMHHDDHTRLGLLQLAPPEYWRDVAETEFAAIDYDLAAYALMSAHNQEV